MKNRIWLNMRAKAGSGLLYSRMSGIDSNSIINNSVWPNIRGHSTIFNIKKVISALRMGMLKEEIIADET
jgi:hypothetical protein